MSESGGERQRDGQPREAEAAAGIADDTGIADDKARLRAELKATLVELAGLQVEIERLASCKHSQGSADGKVCGVCGAEVW